MKYKYTAIVGAIGFLITLPFIIYMLGNLYVYLFDGWQLNGDKMENGFLGFIIVGFLAGLATFVAFMIEDSQ